VTSNAAPREHLRLALERRRVELLRLLLAGDHLEAAFLAQLANVQTALQALAEVADEELGMPHQTDAVRTQFYLSSSDPAFMRRGA
jgi:hypothetical protein